eukprot:439117-Pyramimonas_sp.AAC.1
MRPTPSLEYQDSPEIPNVGTFASVRPEGHVGTFAALSLEGPNVGTFAFDCPMIPHVGTLPLFPLGNQQWVRAILSVLEQRVYELIMTSNIK